jgi:hypothetical protein
VVTWLPSTSAFGRSVHGEAATWDTTDYLLAVIADAVQIGNWQRTGKKRNRPQPIPRPGQDDRHRKKFGTGQPHDRRGAGVLHPHQPCSRPVPAAGRM